MTNKDLGKKLLAIELFKRKVSIRKISLETQVAYTTVQKIIKKWSQTGSTDRRKGSGRLNALTNSDKKTLHTIWKKNPKKSVPQLNELLKNQINKVVSNQTIRRVLHSLGVHAYAPISKPLLSDKNIKLRFELTTNWILLPDDFWKNIIWSDETKINLYNSDGPQKVWREPGDGHKQEYVVRTVKFNGGSIMVWGCFSYYGVGKLVIIEGTMDQYKYLDILKNNLHASANQMGLKQFVFQQDNDPKHKSKLVTKYFDTNNITVLPWPAQSPDLNPIEHVWAYMKRKLQGKYFKKADELKIEIQTIWNTIPLSFLQKLVYSVPKRIEQVVKARGQTTKY